MSVIVTCDDGTTWPTNEIVTSWTAYPNNVSFKTIVVLTASGPGLHINKPAIDVRGRKKGPNAPRL